MLHRARFCCSKVFAFILVLVAATAADAQFPTDLCQLAPEVGDGVYPFSTLNATVDGDHPCTSTQPTDLWLLYTATGTGSFTASTCGAVGDTVLTVWNTDVCIPSPGDQLGCNDDFCGLSSQVTVPVEAGNSYLVLVSGFASGTASGELALEGPAPDNDDCADATPVGEGAHFYSNIGATTDGDQPCSPADELDVWFRYTASQTGIVNINTCNTNDPDVDTVLTLWNTDDCAETTAGNELECSDDDSCGPSPGWGSSVTASVSAGETYLVQISGFNGATNYGDLRIAYDNDNCPAALPVADGFYFYDTNVASDDGFQPCGVDSGVTSDVWFEYIAPCTGELVASTCEFGGSAQDTILTVWEPDSLCPPLPGDQLACSDDACGVGGFASEVSVMVDAGASYLVQVSGWNDNNASGFLSLSCGGTPPNDSCTNPFPVSDGTYNAVSNEGATTDGPSPCGTLESDIWFVYTATCNGNVTVSTCNQAFFNTILAVYPGGCPPLAADAIDCSDNFTGCGTGSIISFPVATGESYLVQLGGAFGAQGSASLTFNCEALPPPNDDCVDAIEIFEGDTPFFTDAATTDGPSTCVLALQDIWYTFTPTEAGVLTVSTCNQATFDTVLAIYPANSGCPPAAVIACEDDSSGCGANSTRLSVFVEQGETYLIQLAGFAGATGTGVLSLTLTPPMPPCSADDSLTHSSSEIPVPGTPDCPFGDSAWWRTFDLDAFGITEDIDIHTVEISVERCAPAGPSLPITVRFYADDDDFPAPVSQLTFLAEETFLVPELTLTNYCLELTTPLNVPAGTTNLVVEVADTDGEDFVLGTNPFSETDVSYLSSLACNLTEPEQFDRAFIVYLYYGTGGGIEFIRGDGNGDGTFNGLVDALFILDFQFQSGAAPPCMEAADADGSGDFNGLLEALYILDHQFQGGAPPPPPYPACGLDPDAAGSLGCNPNGC